ncbi:SpoIIE family protein phosphatase, partial [Nonomuraea wenchangensis]
LDVLGAVLATAALAALAYGLSDAPAVAFAGAGLLAVFALVEVRVARAPLIPPRLVRPRPIWLGNIAMLLAGASRGFDATAATCLYAVCDPQAGRCTMVTAGHPRPRS